jgi:class 3 adenylate cyclase/tRNA A-37 threonylcarbamoyl transferase component Bud32
MADSPTGTVTFLFTDIQGSTAMWERDAKRMQLALARHDEIMKTAVSSHGGHVFKMIGDACCAAFPSAPNALEAALAAQRAIFTEPWDERSRVRVRMALHTGEVEERDGDYFGPSVNRVARLLSAGHGGQTLLSRATREHLQGHLPEGVSVRDMGERRLKDLKEPERIHQLLAPGLPSEFPPLKTLETSSNEDRYRLIQQIGSGGMAEVYLAYDELLQREVAFKVLDRKYSENKEAIERFRREARNAASLRHPNIVDTHDRGETEDGTYYIVMEYLEGGTLEDLIQSEGSLPPREAAEIALEIADALQVAHESGVIHRDIKPQNILLSATGEAKVADFGIARVASATTMTQAGSILGTVHYISPEQALGEPATPQSDLYSLGVVLYEMLTGALPYDAETPVGVVMQHVGGLARSPKDANPDVPEELDSLVSRLLARNPEERQADAATVAEELEGIIPGLPEVPQFDRTRGARTAEGRGNRTTRPGTSGRRRGTGSGRRRGASVGGGLGSRRQRVGVLVAMGLVLVSIGVIAFVVLGQGGGLAAESRTLPEMNPSQLTSEALAPGRYTTKEFDPTLSFTVAEGAGWRMAVPDSPVILEITPAESLEEVYPALTFLSTQGGEVYLPNSQHRI